MRRVTAIIPTLVRLDSIKETLATLVRSDFQGVDFDVAICINSRFTNLFDPLAKGIYPFPVSLYFEPETGKAHALNRVLEDHPNLGDIVVVIDDDISVSPKWLQNIVSVTDRWPEHYYFTGSTYIVWPEREIPEWIHHGILYRWALSSYYNPVNKDIEFPSDKWASGNHFWFRKAALETVGNFRIFACSPQTHIEMAEPAFMLDLSVRGKKGISTPHALCGHRIQEHLLDIHELTRRARRAGRCLGRVLLDPYRRTVPQAVRFQTQPKRMFLRTYLAIIKWFFTYHCLDKFGRSPSSIAKRLDALVYLHQNIEMLKVVTRSPEYRIQPFVSRH